VGETLRDTVATLGSQRSGMDGDYPPINELIQAGSECGDARKKKGSGKKKERGKGGKKNRKGKKGDKNCLRCGLGRPGRNMSLSSWSDRPPRSAPEYALSHP